MTHKPSKVAAAKNVFSSVHVIDATCFNECFWFHVITWRRYFCCLLLLWDFFNYHIVIYFETSALKEVRILCYLHNNSTVLIPMLMLSSKKKLSYTVCILENFHSKLFLWSSFSNSLFFYCSTFLYKTPFILKNSKHL